VLGRRRGLDDFTEEIEAHLLLEAERLREEGLGETEAREAARRAFGNVTLARERFYESHRLALWDHLVQDVAYAWRMLRKAPGFLAVAVATIGLGVGANTAMFTFVNAVLLRPLPFPEPDRLVKILFNNPGTGSFGVRFSVPELDDLRDRSGVFEAVSAACRGSIDLTGGPKAERLEELLVSPTYFAVLGATAARGRVFDRQDETLGYAPAVVISDELWRRRFGADPQVLGRPIRLDNDAYTVVGVLPEDFRHPGRSNSVDVDVWVTSGFSAPPDPPPARSTRALPQAYGRLKPGVSIREAQRRVAAMAEELRREFPGDYPAEGRWTVELQPVQEALVGGTRPVLLVLQAAVALIVVIVSLNMASLVLARAAGRQREMGVRAALGAGEGRLVRLMITESLLLAFLGGVAGVGVAVLCLRLVRSLAGRSIPRLSEVTVDWGVLASALGVSLLAGLLFGLGPALHARRADLSKGIAEGARGSGYGLKTRRLRDLLVVLEVAVAIVLLISGALLVKTLRGLLGQDPGFVASGLVTANVTLPFTTDPSRDLYLTAERQGVFYRELERRLHGLSGVQEAALVSDLPTAGIPLKFTLGVEGRPSRTADELRAEDILVSPGYFQVMRTPIVQGRYLTNADRDGAARVAIVDESTARRYWPRAQAVGRRLRLGQGDWMTIVGVVRDMKHDGLDVGGVPHVYTPIYQEFDPARGVVFRDFSIVLRACLGPRALESQVRGAVEGLDPNLPVYGVTSMAELLDRSVTEHRLAAELVGVFAVLALAIAAVGVYGLIAYVVSQRCRETSLRMALGARRADILKVFLGKGLVLACEGIGLGVGIAAIATSMMASLLYGVRPLDPVVFLAMPAFLLVVAGAASYLPARRATLVEPACALRDA
jgi:putative ABC transport system permease protein